MCTPVPVLASHRAAGREMRAGPGSALAVRSHTAQRQDPLVSKTRYLSSCPAEMDRQFHSLQAPS